MGGEESGGNSVATSSATPLINWWDVHATSSLSSWNTTLYSNSSSCCEDHHLSSVSAPSSDNNHLWTHVLGVESNEEIQNSGETNLMEEVSCKSIMYEPACNYLKQLDTTWDYNHHNNHSSSSSINSNNTTTFDHKYLHDNNGFNDESAVLESDERLSKLVTTWSIAPPHQTNHNTTHFDPSHNDNTDHVTLSSCMDHSGVFSSYAALDMKVKQEHHHHHHASLSEGSLAYHQNNNNNGYNNNSSHHQYGMMMPTRNLTDVISFTGRIGRPIIGIHALKPSFRPPLSSLMTTTVSDHSKKQLFHTSSLPKTRASNGRGQGSSTTEVKKKRTDDSSSQAILKKPKQDTSSTASSTKVQAPKVKLGDRITTLQQIVSPFGKTDTASVLFEAIGYIKFLQEQVQLLSNSYMKTNSHRETTWGSMERKEEKGDLKSRGLCLVPISWTPQSYRDNSTPDYWTPAYRGCLFR
ncbi:hypothetical protein QN277_004614 [Acacia crassicarpa]|uniref:BHLH domain-containing protein n=1 Tax=Acacia crassicarpa TaxID=499986 RepID=A0AAE1JYF1_9FABA|nr:hypothetical protein QN277_004614 [Acacia crassicarpa]